MTDFSIFNSRAWQKPENSIFKISLFGGCINLTLLIATPTSAQSLNIPKLLPPPPPTLPQPQLLPPTLPPLTLPPIPKAPIAPELPEGNVRVTKFNFRYNQVFSKKQLTNLVAPFLDQELSTQQFSQILEKINQFYKDAGYVLAYSTFPVDVNQDIDPSAASLTIDVTEGTVSQINIEGASRLQRYVRSQIHAAVTPAFNIKKLESALRWLSVDPLVKEISTEIVAGELPGQAILKIKLAATGPIALIAGTDNSRTPTVGSWQRSLEFSHANLSGLADRLDVSYLNTQGSNAVQFSYSLPITPQQTTLSLSGTWAKSTIIEEPFNVLDLTSNFLNIDLTLSHPLFRRATDSALQEFRVGLTGSWQDSQSSILGQPFPISPGADDQGNTNLRALRFFQTWSHLGNQQVFVARSEFSVGLDAFGATINPTPPDGQFFSWQGQVLWRHRLPYNLLLTSRSSLQLADRPLVFTEQFTLGGVTTVRGYRNDFLIADNGFASSLELGIPVYNGRKGAVAVSAFFDFGTVWNQGDNSALLTQTIASTGFGIQYNYSDRVSTRLDFGFPLVRFPGDEFAWQDLGISFSVRVGLF
ncbi:MAG: BamA/TamA family outer membrane protein [Aphanocapsa sp. GSE-SYN-MK-11-07L]|nr:BamA/TamA family outer membrane protein [Aphanocapsa sp. GSE-SYN-MK-11-07L]